jgi:flavodoxin
MPRALVVYFSRSNTTRTVAKRLAAQLGAELEEIVDPTRRRGLVGWLRCGFEGKAGKVAVIAPSRPVDGFDVVVVGTPMWAGSLSSPVRAYLRRHRRELGDVAFFCTRGGKGPHEVFRQMAAEAGRAPIAELTVRERELDAPATRAAISDFAERIGRAAAAPPPVPVTAPAADGPVPAPAC